MNLRALAVVILAVLGVTFVCQSQAQPQTAQPMPPVGSGGLKAWLSQTFDEVYVLPGTDLAAYRKVIIEPTKIEFRRGWRQYINSTKEPTRWLTQADQDELTTDFSAAMTRAFADQLRLKGYEVVDAAGPGVLRLTPVVSELFLNAPDFKTAAPTKTFSQDTADATLVLETRDSVSGTVLARFIDKTTAHELRLINYTTNVSNIFWMEALARQWGTNTVKEFEGPKRVQASAASRG